MAVMPRPLVGWVGGEWIFIAACLMFSCPFPLNNRSLFLLRCGNIPSLKHTNVQSGSGRSGLCAVSSNTLPGLENMAGCCLGCKGEKRNGHHAVSGLKSFQVPGTGLHSEPKPSKHLLRRSGSQTDELGVLRTPGRQQVPGKVALKDPHWPSLPGHGLAQQRVQC